MALAIDKANTNDSDRTVVTQQSGILATNGSSGAIGGDMNLTGGYVADESGSGTLTVGGTVNSTHLENTASMSSTRLSGGLGFGAPANSHALCFHK